MTEQEFDKSIYEVFKNTHGTETPFINRGFYQDGMVIDGYVMFYDADNCCGTRDTIILKASERVE